MEQGCATAQVPAQAVMHMDKIETMTHALRHVSMMCAYMVSRARVSFSCIIMPRNELAMPGLDHWKHALKQMHGQA